MSTRESSPSRSKYTKIGMQSRLARSIARSFLVAVASVSLTPAIAWAASQPGSDIEKLETRFFHHTYPKDAMDARLDRLEKMVFGEAKEGAERERLDGLLKLVPEGDESPEPDTTGGGSAESRASRAPRAERPATVSGQGDSTRQPTKRAAQPPPEPVDREDEGTSYPAVSAIEKKLFGREFLEDDVGARLTRLETRTFGKPSKSSDLSERMDALKSATGVDVARHPQSASGWDDEDEEIDYPEPAAPARRSYPGVGMSDSGRSFSGRDVGQDLNRAFGRSSSGTGYGGNGSYGMSGGASGGSGGSGAYGFGPGASERSSGAGSSGAMGSSSSAGVFDMEGLKTPGLKTPGLRTPGLRTTGDTDDDDDLATLPRTAPTRQRPGLMPGSAPPVAPPRTSTPQGSGLTAQLEALEEQVFARTYEKDGLIQRLDRLENTVFPGDRSLKSRTPQDRVMKLASVIPIGTSAGQTQNQPQQIPLAQSQPDSEDLDGDGMPDQNPMVAQQSQRNRGGLSKIINSLGNFLSGGMAVGSYPMPTGNLITDPSTGLLLDQYSGNLINPSTGMVVGRKAGYGMPSGVPGYGFNSFNNGFSSPYYAPYSNPVYGIGGSGIRFGTGGAGIRFGGGTWP